jgi:hypothetical protein
MDSESNFDISTSCEGSEELNPEDASTRNAPMISAPRVVRKMRIRGALVPCGDINGALGKKL